MQCSTVGSLQWRHNERDGVSNHQPYDCILNHLFKAHIKENIKAPRQWSFCGEFTGDRGTRKIFLFDDVIMLRWYHNFVKAFPVSIGWQMRAEVNSADITRCVGTVARDYSVMSSCFWRNLNSLDIETCKCVIIRKYVVCWSTFWKSSLKW